LRARTATGRLRTPAEFRAVYAGGQRRTSRSFVVFILPSDGPVTRFGLTTPKKLGKAHERNRIRRRVREILGRDSGAPGPVVDIVINPRRSVLTRDFEELGAELWGLLRAAM
jgi:ribonuclease P protein component